MIDSFVAQVLILLCVLVYAGFWVWAVIHAIQTPRASISERTLWGVAMIANPLTAIWYWYIWKRWAFWALFTPLLLGFVVLPFAVGSLLGRANETAISNALFALGSTGLVVLITALMIFPLLIGLAALLHLAKNTDLSAIDRNDWIVSLALPFFGFGAGIAYCAKYSKGWAAAGLLWWVVTAMALHRVGINISHALIFYSSSISASSSPSLIETPSSSRSSASGSLNSSSESEGS